MQNYPSTQAHFLFPHEHILKKINTVENEASNVDTAESKNTSKDEIQYKL